MKKEMKDLKAQYNSVPVPAEAKDRILAGIAQAKSESANEMNNSRKIIRFPLPAKIAVGVAAAFAVCFISVNSSGEIASAAAKLPVIGKFFEVITVQNYHTDEVVAEIPQIQANDSLAGGEVNSSSRAYIERVIAQFEAERESAGSSPASLDISYNVLTDNERYFAVDIAGTDTEASGYEFHRFYTIDKASDEVLTLEKLFAGKDYISPISDEIKRQMDADADAGYITGEDGFRQIAADQSFFINSDGNIVICFDEYEVGPGSLGAVQFVIPSSVTSGI